MMKGYTRAELVEMCNSMKDQLIEDEKTIRLIFEELESIKKTIIDLINSIKND